MKSFRCRPYFGYGGERSVRSLMVPDEEMDASVSADRHEPPGSCAREGAEGNEGEEGAEEKNRGGLSSLAQEEEPDRNYKKEGE